MPLEHDTTRERAAHFAATFITKIARSPVGFQVEKHAEPEVVGTQVPSQHSTVDAQESPSAVQTHTLPGPPDWAQNSLQHSTSESQEAQLAVQSLKAAVGLSLGAIETPFFPFFPDLVKSGSLASSSRLVWPPGFADVSRFSTTFLLSFFKG